MKQWFSDNKRNILLAILLFLIITISFGLGYLANREFNRAPIIIETSTANCK